MEPDANILSLGRREMPAVGDLVAHLLWETRCPAKAEVRNTYAFTISASDWIMRSC